MSSPDHFYGDQVQKAVEAYCKERGVQPPQPRDTWYGIEIAGSNGATRTGFFIHPGAPDDLAEFVAAWIQKHPG